MPKQTRRKPGEVPPLPDDMAQMLRELDLSPKTKRAYFWGLQALVSYLTRRPITETTLIEYAADLREHDNAPRTVGAYLVAAKRYLRWLGLRDHLPQGVSYQRMAEHLSDAGKRREGYRQRKTDPRILCILDYYGKDTPKEGAARLRALRNHALLWFLYDTGTRISEALALTRAEVQDGEAGKVRLTETKNGKPRTVFVGKEARALIRAYVAARQDGADAPLFVSHGRDKGEAITPARACQIVKEAAKALGLYKSTSPHTLRHARAQGLLDEGMPLEWVAALLGHEHPDTTRTVYAFETDEDKLADMVETYGKH